MLTAIKYSNTGLRVGTSLALNSKKPKEEPRQLVFLVIGGTKREKLHIKEGEMEETLEVQQREQCIHAYGNQCVPLDSPRCGDGHLCVVAGTRVLPQSLRSHSSHARGH